MMNSGELEDTTGIPETSRPASAASFTDVQTIETKTPPHDTCPQQGAASSTPAHNTDNMESFSDTEYHQELSAGDQAQVRCIYVCMYINTYCIYTHTHKHTPHNCKEAAKISSVSPVF